MITLFFYLKYLIEKKELKSFNNVFYYNSFDGTVRSFYLGNDYFESIIYERKLIENSNLYSKIIEECKKINNKTEVIQNLKKWILPDSIFVLMPLWWKNNGNTIQSMSPFVIAIHDIIKQEL